MFRGSSYAVAIATFNSALFAQTFIVDTNNGPGTHFTDLGKAIAAVQDGAILRVRDGRYGNYGTLTITNKSLSIIGDSKKVEIAATLQVGPLRSHDRVLLANYTQFGTFAPYLRVRDCAGVLVFKDVNALSASSVPVPQYEFLRCANVQIFDSEFALARFVDCVMQASHSTFWGKDAVPTGRSNWLPAGQALQIQGGRAHLSDCTVRGGWGLTAFCIVLYLRSTPGAPAASLTGGAKLTLFGGRCTGGTGGSGSSSCNLPGSDGGAGVVLAGSELTAVGAHVVGGTGGFLGGKDGKPFVKDASSSVVLEPNRAATIAGIEGAVAAGKTVQLTLTAKQGSVALLLLGTGLTNQPLAPVGLGNLYCVPSIVLGLFTVPNPGTLKIPVSVPTNWVRDVPTYGQFLSLQGGPTLLWGSNPVLLLVRS